ncbi:MAG: type IVB secretion system apparatus protein IcmL/DotI [Gammaproteobacteria bacterium]|nr:type IVB secretion system apparatus protein IcmL/DotI [Gammaproteobacteria bacterium]
MPDSALEVVQMRKNFYRDSYRRVVTALLFMILVSLILSAIIYYLATHRPEPKYFATSADGRITPIYPLTAPMVSDSALLQWANQAAVAAYTYNFATYRKELQDASEFFTPEGWNDFETALQSSRNLETVINKKLVVTAVATGAPVILDRGVLNNHYSWKVQMPLLVTYESASTTIQQPILVTMLITRVSALNVPKGIAIASFVASETSGGQNLVPTQT